MAGLVPSDTVLQSWNSFGDARTWAGLSSEDWKKVATAVGDPELDSLLLVASLPVDAMRELLASDKVELSMLTKSKVSLAINAARAAHLQPVANFLDPNPVENPVQESRSSTAQPAGGTGLKIKLSQVIDQASDQEVMVLPASEIMVARRRYKELGGEAPLVKAEVTDAQLSALAFRMREGPAPYADFGVWGPHGARIERRLKFTAYMMMPGGAMRTLEMPGAESLATWRECWSVFRTAAIMLSVALAGVLDRYEAMFVDRCERYPNAWHICAQADIRCRSEMWVTERWAQEEFHSSHPSLSAFNPAMPWNSVIKASATNTEFWDRELKEPAQNFSFSRFERQPSVPKPAAYNLPAPPQPPQFVGRQAQPGKKRKKSGVLKGQANPSDDARRPDGRYYRDRHGTELCYTYNRSENGCASGTCPSQRSHACEWCRQPHRAIGCPKHPGWTPPTMKGGGKGAQHF
jgi:hypothetical protein